MKHAFALLTALATLPLGLHAQSTFDRNAVVTLTGVYDASAPLTLNAGPGTGFSYQFDASFDQAAGTDPLHLTFQFTAADYLWSPLNDGTYTQQGVQPSGTFTVDGATATVSDGTNRIQLDGIRPASFLTQTGSDAWSFTGDPSGQYNYSNGTLGVYAVPEPSSVGLLGVTLVGAAGFAWARSRRTASMPCPWRQTPSGSV